MLVTSLYKDYFIIYVHTVTSGCYGPNSGRKGTQTRRFKTDLM